MDTILKTCLYDRHVLLNAKMEPFAGYWMPISYTGIIEEHQAVRNHSGMFDVSHMGEIRVTGKDAIPFIEYVTTNEIQSKPFGKVIYGLILYDNGTCVDDLLVYKVADDELFLCVNASNVAKDYTWIVEHTEGFDVLVKNESDKWSEIAVQGPETEKIVMELMHLDLTDLTFYTFKYVVWDGHLLLISRTGYTGEDGFEIYGDCVAIPLIWDLFQLSGKVLPCGLGCRDTLRFEASLPLYGHEISDQILPIEAGLGSFVKFEKRDFIGKNALLMQKAAGLVHKLIGIELTERAIPRQGYEVFSGDLMIGHITTGYLSISTDKCIANALIDTKYAVLGEPIFVQIRKKMVPGIIRNRQYYKKNYKQ
ncbi:MAG: glycine cleavage system aminomethyltransferase GcvT [Candidatus Izemoplasmatales bacterium]|jgi:aminomethyltransferase|nr:glycine cleavage system aminomethyltransferase GcvT [Candidatus Izemoplasmatales bacterium]MDD4595864.1 glycine cleavage system aminomethyltransferase GcvT [Candidatus Izemoplasmatales bacterium]